MLTLRPTTAVDLQDVIGWEAEPDTVIWLGGTGHAWHARALDDPDQEHLIGLDSAVPVGFVVLAGLRAGKVIELRRMVVSAAHRGAGRGRALLLAALARAYDRHGARAVWLDVKPANVRARALYESAGFVATETRTDAIPEPDGTRSDLIIMTHRGPAPGPDEETNTATPGEDCAHGVLLPPPSRSRCGPGGH